MPQDDFASLMASSTVEAQSRARRRFKAGDAVEGKIVEITSDSLFVDVGGTSEARLNRDELADARGNLRVKIGDGVRATVKSTAGDAIELTIAIGRGGATLDTSSLEIARHARTPVEGKVTKVVKAGLEIDIGGIRAFCPASQVDLGYVADLTGWEGRTLDVCVTEIKDGGRSVIVSRRALLEAERAERQREVKERLSVGAELDGTVHSIQKHGVLVDVGGLEGFVHISELSHSRVDRMEDAVKIGEAVRVRVLAIEESPKGLRVRLSIKALQGVPAGPGVAPDEVLDGRVTRHTTFGLFVDTAKGEGLVPTRELGLPPGSDHRRSYPAGASVRVVLLSRDASSGKLRFSVAGVAGVEERKNFKEFSATTSGSTAAGLGSLGDVLRQKLGLPPAPPEPPAPRVVAPDPAPAAAAATGAASAASTPGGSAAPAPVAPAPSAPVRRNPPNDPVGVHRRRR